MMSRLQGKVVLITGASAGIGAACAREFAKHGSVLILTARRVERLTELKADILREHPKLLVHLLPLDIQSNTGIKAGIAALPKEFTPIHVLVNNAGLAQGSEPVSLLDADNFDTMINTNVKGLLYMTQAVLPQMIKQNAGYVINISSIAGKNAFAGAGGYCATKHAVDALTRTLRIELLSTNINVVSIEPGLVKTEFSLVKNKGDEEKAEAAYIGLELLSGEDVAEATVFAASRRPNVCIGSLMILPTCQTEGGTVHRPSPQ